MIVTKNHFTQSSEAGFPKSLFRKSLFVALTMFMGLQGLIGIKQAAAQDKPNIIYLFVDDLSSGMTGFTNPNTPVKTPNLDALAVGGLQFTQAYANAVCSPSRGSMYTGFHLGHTINDENVENFRSEDIMPGEMMKTAGYRTATYGKWGYGSTSGAHTGSGGVDSLRRNPVVTNTGTLPTSHGYDDFVGYLNHVQAHRFFNDPLWQSDSSSSTGVRHFVTGNNAGDNVTNTFLGYTDDHHTREAMKFITASVATDSPFMIQMHYNSPHPPFDPGQQLTYDFEGNPRVWDQDYQGMGLSVKQRQLAVMITRLDEHVGALVALLRDPDQDGNEADSILQDTVILFTSDNGGEATDTMSDAEWRELGGNNIYGVNRRGGKRDLYEGGLRVPAFAYWPGTIAPNQFTGQPIDLADFMPTVAELGGIEPPIGLDGVSYAGLLTGEGMPRTRSHLVWEHHERDGPDPDSRDPRWSVLKNNFKLIHFSNGSEDLYDLTTDPEETQPLNLTIFADMRAEFEEIAVAEGITQPADGYSALHVDWVGGDQDSTTNPANWSNYDPLQEVWVSVIENGQSADSSISFEDADFLGIEVKGDTALQTIRVSPAGELVVRNELRVSANGRAHLDSATLNCRRWLDVKTGGQLTGTGDVSGQLYNWGSIAPGLPADLTVASPSASGNGSVSQGITLFSGNEPTENVIFDAVSGGSIGTIISSQSARGQNFVVGQAGTTVEIGGVTIQSDGTQTFSTGDEMTIAIFSGDNFAGADLQNITPAGLATAPGIAILHQETFQLPSSVPNDSFLIIGFENPVDVNGGEQLGMMVFTNTNFRQSEGSNNGGGRLIYRTSGINTAVSRDMRFSILGSAAATGGDQATDEPQPINANETGLLSLAGNFFHQPGAELLLQVSGVDNSDPADYQFDQVVVDGAMSNGGSLVVELMDDYVPQDGDTITLVQTNSLVGDFSSVTVLGTPNGFDAEVQIDSDNVVLTLTGTVAAPGEVLDVVMNQGAAQRSMLMEIDVTFSGNAQFGDGAFSVVNREDDASVDVSVDSTTVGDNTIATLTFSGQYAEEPSGSLVDGNYSLTIDGSQIVDAQGNNYDADGDGSSGGVMVMGDQAGDNFYRLFGDIDGNRLVTLFDFLSFRSVFALSSGDALFEEGFDSDANGIIVLNDFLRFRQNFGKSLSFE